MSEIVTLTNYQISLAAQVGCMRVTETLRMKQSWGFNYKEPVYFQFAKSISGACAEFAVAHYLKIAPQIHVNHGAKADIKVNGTEIQVKSHLYKNDKKPLLYIRQNARPGELFCFVSDKSPEFHILGFIMASDIICSKERLTDFGLLRPPVFQLDLDELKPLNKIV